MVARLKLKPEVVQGAQVRELLNRCLGGSTLTFNRPRLRLKAKVLGGSEKDAPIENQIRELLERTIVH